MGKCANEIQNPEAYVAFANRKMRKCAMNTKS
jgi:hypothetical protein